MFDLGAFWRVYNHDGGAQNTQQAAQLTQKVEALLEEIRGQHSTENTQMMV